MKLVEPFYRLLSSSITVRKVLSKQFSFSANNFKALFPHLVFNKPPVIMNPIYFRYVNGADSFQVAFEYNNDTFNISRQFNMDRSVNETVSDFKNRIKSNIVKILEKKVHTLNRKKDKEVKILVPNVAIDIIVNGRSLNEGSLAKDCIFDPDIQDKDNLLLVDQTPFTIICNAPWIKSFKLPSVILAGCLVYPIKFESLFMIEDRSDFQWFREVDKQFIPVAQGFYYKVSNMDVGHRLMLSCTPRNEKSEGPTMEIVSNSQVQAITETCLFEQRHAFTRNKLEGDSFRVVTYNILAEIYADTDVARTQLFSYCPTYAIEGEYRRQLIIQELLGYNADLICLQEVDEKFYKRDLEPVLKKFQNLEGNLCLKNGTVAEGLAIFYRSDRFRMIEAGRYVLGDELQLDHLFNKEFVEKIKTNEQLYKRIIERNTTLQTLVLQPHNEQKLLFLANTHLYFHPDADHIRLMQSALFMKYIQHTIVQLHQKSPGFQITLIFCGDFNSTPDCGFYHLMTENKVPPDVPDWKSNAEETIEGIPLFQPYPMGSACGTPETTNFTEEFKACLDYIYYQKDHLKVSQVIPLPSKEELELFTALPSPVHPSDHLALVADLEWIR